jgi:hypothetical protein
VDATKETETKRIIAVSVNIVLSRIKIENRTVENY